MIKHVIYKITQVSLVGPYTLKIQVDDGMERVTDFSDILRGLFCGPLQTVVFLPRCISILKSTRWRGPITPNLSQHWAKTQRGAA